MAVDTDRINEILKDVALGRDTKNMTAEEKRLRKKIEEEVAAMPKGMLVDIPGEFAVRIKR